LETFVGEKPLESYEKTLRVGPVLNEGAKLEVDHAFLDYLATQSGGAYFRESDFGKLAETLRDRIVEKAVTVDVPLVQHHYVYLLALLAILALEWTIRWKMALNLLKKDKTFKVGLKTKAKACSWDHQYLLNVLTQ